MPQIQFNKTIEGEIVTLVQWLAGKGRRWDSTIPHNVASVQTILYAQQEGVIRKTDTHFILTGKGVER